jgi:hypothetical protein
MHATIRRYEGVDQNRIEELTRKLEESLLPQLSKLDGFGGYYLVEAGNNVMTSINFFDTATQGEESTRLSSSWVRDQKLETIVPNPPKITSGEIIAHERALVPVA